MDGCLWEMRMDGYWFVVWKRGWGDLSGRLVVTSSEENLEAKKRENNQKNWKNGKTGV